MEKRLKKFLKISDVEAHELAAKIHAHINANENETFSKKKKMKSALKALGWSHKEISHFVYGPTKSKN